MTPTALARENFSGSSLAASILKTAIPESRPTAANGRFSPDELPGSYGMDAPILSGIKVPKWKC
jgi:hypothetical protein